jgi:hypothetical protein
LQTELPPQFNLVDQAPRRRDLAEADLIDAQRLVKTFRRRHERAFWFSRNGHGVLRLSDAPWFPWASDL